MKRTVILNLSIFVVALTFQAAAMAAAPDWVADATNSRWIVFGGATGLVETNGITVREHTGEGDLKPISVGDETGAQSLTAAGQQGFFYLVGELWDQMRTWLGDGGLLLTVRYYDGGPGKLVIRYDSSDPRVKFAPYPPGVWRSPEEYPQGVPLTGSKQWKTVTMRLPLALFTKRVHGADLRLDPSGKDFTLAGVAWTRLPKGQEPVVLVKQALRVARATGMEICGETARFAGTFAQSGDAPLMMEAELATELTPQQGCSVGSDAAASNSGFLHFVEHAVYRFTVVTPGRYVLWERGFFPWPGGWLHYETLDGGGQVVVNDGAHKPEEGWQWIKAQTVELAAGEHTLGLNYCNGARLDVLVLSRADAPPDLATLKSSYRGALTGEVWTTPVQPLDVAQWRGVQFNLAATGPVSYELSTDAGQTWRPFDPREDLTKITVAGGGRDSLQFHLELSNAGGTSPGVFAGGQISYQAGPRNSRVIENARLKIEIDPYGIKSIYDKRAGALVSAAAMVHDALALLTVKKPGPAATQMVDLYSGTLEKIEVGGTTDAPVLTMRHRLDNGMRLTTTARLLPDGESEWQLAIDNATDLEVAEFEFPVVTGLKLGGDPADDWIFVPRCWGQVWKNPAAETALHSTVEGGGGATPMRWCALWDDRQGFYLGIEDPRHEDYGFVYGGDSSGGTTLAPWQRTLVKPHSCWQSGVYRLALTGGDWHEGADIYRRYVTKTLQPTEVTPLVKWQVDAWDVQPAQYAQTIGWEMVRPGGQPLMAAWRSMLDGADAGYCGLYPYPAPAWGTTREFSQKLAVRRACGQLYTSYHNFHLWSAGYGHYPRIATFPKASLPADAPQPDDDWYRRAASYTYDGAYQRLEKEPFYTECPMAMASTEWRDWLADWTRRYLDWGADGMYYDQFNMIYQNGKLYPGFDTYGCWAPATLAAIARIRKASRARDPYYTSSGEVCNDLYGQYLDLHMVSGVWNRLDFFRYCLPHQLMIDGMQNGGLRPEFGGQERCRFIWQVGARFDYPPADQRILPLRRAVKSLLYDAQFEDTVGLTVRDAAGRPLAPEYTFSQQFQLGPFRGVIGRWFLYQQGGQRGAIVNLINFPVQKGATVALETKSFGPVQAAFAWTLEGQCVPVPGRQQGDLYTFAVPESELSSVVLANQLVPVVEWDLEAAAAPGVTRQFSVKLTNVDAEPVRGTAQLRLPRGWRAPATVAFGPIPSGQAQSFTITFTVPPRAKKGRYDLWCDLKTARGEFAAYRLLVVNDPVLADFRGNPGTYHVWLKNLTTEPLVGTIDCRAGTTASGALALQVNCPREFALPPEAEVRLPVTVVGQDKLAAISEMSARVKVGKLTIEVVRGVIPTVPNGAFELDAAGDGKPDWWMCRTTGDAFAYERVRLAGGAHGGKHCLELDPPAAGDQFSCAYPVNSSFKPNTRYRVSLWIKAASKDGVFANVLGVEIGKGQTGPDWKQFTAEIVTGSGLAGLDRTLFNYSASPAYFDDFTIEEIGDR